MFILWSISEEFRNSATFRICGCELFLRYDNRSCQGKLRTAEYEEGSAHVPGAFLLLICPSGVCAASCSAALFPDLPPRRHPVGHPN